MRSDVPQHPTPLLQYEDDPGIIYVIDTDFRIVYCNAAWDRFAMENGGEHLLRETQIGRSVLEVTPIALLRFYQTLYDSVIRDRERQGRDVLFECSSPDTYRRFHMHLALRQLAGGQTFLVVVNSLVIEKPYPADGMFRRSVLRDINGMITMCAHCRRVRIPGSIDTRVWAPDLVKEMPAEVSHDICGVCFDLHHNA
jgi:hypothetical protein